MLDKSKKYLKNLRIWKYCFLSALFFIAIFSMFKVVNGVFIGKEVRVGVYDNKPKVYEDNNGVISGIYPDVLDYIAEQENWELKYVHGTWEEGLARLKAGEIDLMVDMAVSEERLKEFDFTNETLLNSWGVVCTNKKTKIESFQDLNNKKIAILKSSVYLGEPDGIDIYVKAFGLNVQFVYVDEYNQTYDLLNKGEVDAAVVSRIFAMTNQKNYPNVIHTNIIFKPTELKFAFTKGSSDNPYLINKIDYWIKKLKNDPDSIYFKSLEKYGLTEMASTQEVTPKWVFPLISITAVTLLFLLFYISILIRKKLASIQELQKSENKFHSLYESMTEMVVLHEIIRDKNEKIIDYRIIDCNPSFSNITSIPQKKAIGALASELYGTKEAPYLSIYANVVMTGYPYRFETFFQSMNKYFDISVFSFDSNKFGTIATDITDYKKVQKTIEIKNKELENRVQELEHINETMIGRELKMLELKKEIENLKKK